MGMKVIYLPIDLVLDFLEADALVFTLLREDFLFRICVPC